MLSTVLCIRWNSSDSGSETVGWGGNVSIVGGISGNLKHNRRVSFSDVGPGIASAIVIRDLVTDLILNYTDR